LTVDPKIGGTAKITVDPDDVNDYFDSAEIRYHDDVNDYFPDVDYFLFYDYVDYFLYPKTSTSTTSTTERLLPLLRLLPPRPGDTGVIPKIAFFPASNPKIPLFPHVCTINPNPNTYALFSITCHLFL
jgi:hypothetical protein